MRGQEVAVALRAVTQVGAHASRSMSPSFQAFLIGGKIPLGRNHVGIVISKAVFSEIKHHVLPVL